MDLSTDALVDAVRRLVVVESPTEDLGACANAVDTAVTVCTDWLATPARVLDHAGRPVLRWGPDRPRVLLLGHLDTVWPVGTIDRLPWTAVDGRMTGPGVFDMKAGVVQAIGGLALASATDEVGLLLTTDEETGSLTSRDLIADAVRNAEAVLVFEPSLDGRMKTRRKGTSWYVVDFIGKAAHAGLDPERGINALLEASRFALATTQWADASAGTTVTPTMLNAGTTANTVAAQAALTLDVRAWTGTEQQRVDDQVRGWTAQAGDFNVRGGIDRAALESAMSVELATLAERTAAALGQPPLGEAAVGGASDGNLTAAHGIRTLDGLGAVGDGAHADHEWASIDALVPRAELTAALIDAILAGSWRND